MLNANGSILTDNRSALTQWANAALGLSDVQVQVRVRGNHLHILCEALECPPVELAVAKFSVALEQTDLEKLLHPDRPRIYQVFVCGRRLGARQNDWTVRLEYSHQSRQPAPIARAEAPTPHRAKGAKPSSQRQPEGGRSSQRSPVENSPTNSIPPLWTEAAVVAKRQETESFTPSPLTIDTSVTPSSNVSSIPLQRSTYSTVAEPATSQSTATLEAPPTIPDPALEDGTLTISSERLARRGYPDAIASYLSEILGAMGVTVKVTIRDREPTGPSDPTTNPPSETPKPTERRLLVLCESAYSPDPSLLAEPIAQRLRDLELEEFRDAVICSQVQGEAKLDWILKVDLTPPSQMLKEWARWGDIQAIARLLNQKLADIGVTTRATLKESTLHLFCRQQPEGGKKKPETATDPGLPQSAQTAPDKLVTREAIVSLLSEIAPQGIHAATVYGLETATHPNEESPLWIDWLNLPAAHHPDLAASPLQLAAEGDPSALKFLLNRLLNPNLDRKLQTGGIRVMLLRKGGLLHVMSEALTCPSQAKVGPPIAEFLRQMPLPGVAGVRIYGRRAGQKLPLWRYGVDFTPRQKSSPKPAQPLAKVAKVGLASFENDIAPEFAPSAADLAFPGLPGKLVFHPDLPTDGIPKAPSRPRRQYRLGEGLLQILQRSLIRVGLFVPNDALSTQVGNSTEGWPYWKSTNAFIWAASGCLLAIQIDGFVGQFLQSLPPAEPQAVTLCQGGVCQPTRREEPKTEPSEAAASPSQPFTPPVAKAVPAEPSPLPQPEVEEATLPQLPLQPSSANDPGSVFNGSGFTKPGAARVTLSDNYQVAAPTQYPSFRSEQLDEQLARYQKYIQAEKRPPDILIVGSSRALRGVDPTVLEATLASQGYSDLKVFNFGVNGATVQVVDLIVRRILSPKQLPKLIVLADGARAVNGGRVDVTYNAISLSEGYQQLAQGTFQIRTDRLAKAVSQPATRNPLAPVVELVQNLDRGGERFQQFLNQKLADISASYRQRDRLKTFLQSHFSSQPSLTTTRIDPTHQDTGSQAASDTQLPNSERGKTSEFQTNGFLPIELRFAPEAYYAKYSKVSGDYDSDYQDFQLNGRQTVALSKLAEFTRERNIDFVFVNMPLTKDYLDPVRSRYEEAFQLHMQQFAAENGVIFRDMGELWPEERDYFSDPSHLNRYGAIAVSKHLASDPMIPWPKR